jgi:23S rRNA (uracil1939-C5)-methyltransferase
VNGKRTRVERGTVVEGVVRDITDAGESVVTSEQGIVMVRGGLPGERVRLRLLPARRGVARGSLLSVVSASPQRIEPACGLAQRCGGCPLMSLTLDAQRELKLQRVRHALSGVCAPEAVTHLEAAGAALGYRQRARFGFRRVGAEVVLGYHAAGSRLLVDVDACLVLDTALSQALSRVRSRLAPTLTGSGEVELTALDATQVIASVRCDAAVAPEAYRAAEALAAERPLVGVSLRVGDGAAARFGDLGSAVLDAEGTALHRPANGFSQVNAGVNVRLGELVFDLAEPRGALVIELYAGWGNFSLALAAEAQAFLAVESNQVSARACRENLRLRGRNSARVLVADVASARLPERCDVIVLDPPRGGAPPLAAIVARTRPERVVYVSCHTTTLSRDLRALQAAGYAVDRVHALDMFPQTAHVEAVVRMRAFTS